MLNQLIINVLQNLLFCVPKTTVLHGKSVGFASQNRHFRNAKSKLSFFFRIIFTKPRRFYYLTQGTERKTISPKTFCFSSIFTIRKRHYTNGITPFISNITIISLLINRNILVYILAAYQSVEAHISHTSEWNKV